MAEETGGGHFALPEGADLTATFARVADELRRQYVIGFSPGVLDGQLHRVDVRVGRAGDEGQGPAQLSRRTLMMPIDNARRTSRRLSVAVRDRTPDRSRRVCRIRLSRRRRQRHNARRSSWWTSPSRGPTASPSPDSPATTSRSSPTARRVPSNRLRPARNNRSRWCCSSTPASAWNSWWNGRSCEPPSRKWFVDRLAPQDRVQVGSFAKQIAIGPPLAGNPRALLDGGPHGARPTQRGHLRPVADLGRGRRGCRGAGAGERPARGAARDRRTSAPGNRQGPEESGARAIAAGVAVSVVGEDWEMTLRQDAKTGVLVRPGAALEWIAERDRRTLVQDNRHAGGAGADPRASPRRPARALHARLHAAGPRRQGTRPRSPRQTPGPDRPSPPLVCRTYSAENAQ